MRTWKKGRVPQTQVLTSVRPCAGLSFIPPLQHQAALPKEHEMRHLGCLGRLCTLKCGCGVFPPLLLAMLRVF